MKARRGSHPPRPLTEAPTGMPARPAVRLGKRVAAVIGGLLLLPWLVILVWFRADSPPRAAAPPAGSPDLARNPVPRTFRAAPGPWGRLVCTRIALEVPGEFIFTHLEGANHPEWFFKGHSREQVAALFAGAGLTAEQLDSLMLRANWTLDADGVRVHPEPALVLELNPEARQRIYTVLTRFWENQAQRLAYVFKPELLSERFEGSGLRPELVAKVRGLIYPQGRFVMFADLYPLMCTLEDNAEKTALAKVVSRQWTYLIQLHIEPGDDVQQLVEYWGNGPRAKDLRPLLESLQRVPGGTDLDITHLLPQFARRRLYTFPVPTSDPVALRHDCHWTAYNFFSDQLRPDDRFIHPEFTRQVFEANYEPVSGAPRFGDLLTLFSPDAQVLHSAIYVADDFVFCKNGAHFSQPWMLMKQADMMDYYIAVYQPDHPIIPRFFRRKAE